MPDERKAEVQMCEEGGKAQIIVTPASHEVSYRVEALPPDYVLKMF